MTRIVRAALAATLACSLMSAAIRPADPEPTPIEDVQGNGRRALRFACAGCAVGFIVMSGTGSILGLAYAIGAAPEMASACIIACVEGFGG